MLEKRFAQVAPQAFTADGTTDGKISVPDTRLFKVKQKIFLQSDTQQQRDGLEIKRILSSTQMIVGPEKSPIHVYSDVSDFLVADTAIIAANEQFRPIIPVEEINRAVYEEEPVVAMRSMLVDKGGNDYRKENPLPVQLSDGSVNIGSVNAELEVQLSHKNNYPNVGDIADSVRVGDGVDELAINSDGSINIGNFPTNIDADVEVDAADGDNIGLQVQQRNLLPDDTKYSKRVTAVTGTGANADTTSLDTSLHDHNGNPYTVTNPLPVQLSDGSVNIGSVNAELEVQLSHKNNYPNVGDIADSVRVGDGTRELAINTDGSINIGNFPTVIDVETNAADGDNIGLQVQQRGLSPDDTKYSKRVTAVTGTGIYADTTSIDVSLHDQNGNAYSQSNPLPINSTQILNRLQVPLDFFGNQSVATRTNQVEVPLDNVNWTNYVDITQSSTGTSTQSSGQVTIYTGTNASGRYAIASKDYVKYRPNSEIGWGFTWVFKTPSVTNSVMRIGATDSIDTWNNGVYFNHENGIFSLVYRRNGTTIFSAPQTSWLDACNGGTTSQYVDMNGAPVILDISKDQLSRVRAGLFGHAGFIVELLAPNQSWVTIYRYANINSADVPIFGTFNLKIGAEVKKTGDGTTNLSLASACWAGWTGSTLTRIDEAISDRTLAQVTRTVIEGKTSAGGGTYVPVKVTPSGSLTVSIGDIDGVKGQKTMAESMPVTMASDQPPMSTYLNPTSLNEIGFKQQYVDPFGRLVVASPYQVGTMDHRIGKHDDYWSELLVGSGTATHNANTASLDMSCTTANGDKVIRQTYRQFEYRRGNSQAIYISGNIGAIKNGTLKQMGYFDSQNGVFFQTNSTTFSVVRRTYTSGSLYDEVIDQANFNMDTMDGTGGIRNPSGLLLDLSKHQMFIIEFSWLGTNVIDFSLMINGKKIMLHRMNHSNVILTPWSKSGQLPVRAYMENTSTVASSTTMSLTCVVVFSNGSPGDVRQIRSISSGINSISITATEKVFAGIRLKPNLRNIGVEPVNYSILSVSGGVMYYKMILRPTLVGATWSDYSEGIQTLTNNPTYTGGIVLDEGQIALSATNRTKNTLEVLSDAILGYSINNDPDSLIFVARTDSGAGSFYFSMNYREIV